MSEETTQQPSDEALKKLYGDDIPTKEKIQEILFEVRPYIQMHGGDLELVEVDLMDGEVRVRLTGSCVGCPASTYTLKQGIEEYVQERYPDLEVVSVG